MHTALIFQCAVDIISGHGKNYFLESSGGAFRKTCHRHLPSLRFAITGIHFKQVAGKEGGLIATCTAANFYNGIAGIFRVSRNQHNFDFLLKLWKRSRSLVELFMSHRAHFAVILCFQNLPCFLLIVEQLPVATCGCRKTFQALIFFVQTHITLHIGNYSRIGYQRRNFLKSRFYAVETAQ